jgi:hypothetical protein
MPRRATHDAIGFVTGAVDGARLAKNDESPRPGIEMIAGAGGGLLGSRFPDLAEPGSLGPRHRSIAHSAAMFAFVAGLRIADWQVHCRANGADHDAAANSSDPKSLVYAMHRLCAWFWYAMAGFVAGLRTGYLSHLVADFTTASSLPLIA